MQTATSETESKSLDLSICVHHYTLRAPCPKGQGNHDSFGGPSRQRWSNHARATDLYPYSDPMTCTCTRRRDTA